MIPGCIFDMCSYEDDDNAQTDLKCNLFKKATDTCHELADRAKIDLNIAWREYSGCREYFSNINLLFLREFLIKF